MELYEDSRGRPRYRNILLTFNTIAVVSWLPNVAHLTYLQLKCTRSLTTLKIIPTNGVIVERKSRGIVKFNMTNNSQSNTSYNIAFFSRYLLMSQSAVAWWLRCLASKRELAGSRLRWITTSGLAWSLYKCVALYMWRAVCFICATERPRWSYS